MLILPIHVTHNRLTHTVTAFNVTHGRDAYGRPAVVQGADYQITDANVQPAGDELVKLLPEGAQKEGAVVMHTRATLYAASNESGGTSTEAQSYIRHNGQIWKAWQVQNWAPHTKIGRYILTRYVDADGTIQ